MIRHLLVALVLSLVTAGAVSASTFDHGVKQYSQGNVAAARKSFETVVQDDPNNAYGHYFLANCLGRQGLHSQALARYENAKKLCAHPQLQEYCDKAINHYETLELTKDYYAKAAVEANKVASKSAAALAAQHKIKQQIANKMASNFLEEARCIAARINSQADLEIDMLPRGRRSGAWREQIANEIRAEAAKKQKIVMENSQYRAAAYKRQAEAEAEAYREAAVNLSSLMVAPVNRNGFGLSPYGTNLYVRNYTRP